MPQQRFQHSGIATGLPYGLRLVIVAILAALATQPAMVSQTHAQSSVPTAPTGLIATSVSHDSVTLGWDDPGDTSITGYEVLRRDTVNQAPGAFSTVEPNTGSAATTYTDSTVAAETRYVYRVKSINSAGTSEQSNYVNVETPAGPTPSVPAAPTGLTASSVSHDGVTLSWDDPGDDTITGYQVLRRSRDGDEYGDGRGAASFVAVIDDTGSTATTYTDTSVTARTRYVYRVKAINSEGMGERSTYLNAETPEEPAPGPTPTNASPTGAPTITGTAQVGETLTADTSGISDADGLTNAAFGYQWLADDTEIQGATHHSYTLADADKGKAITVRVSFTDDRGNDETLTSAATSAVAPRQAPGAPPPPPTNLTAVANSDGSVTLTWAAPDDDSITGYQVLRRHPGETENTMVETVVNTEDTATTFTDSDLTLGVLHAYSVKAISAAGLSGRSNYDNATPHTDSTPITVYLTFDDGPEPPYTDQILDLLQRYGARATFFVTGLNAALHPDLLARMASERHSIGNHTWQHESLSGLSSDEFNSTVMRTQEQIGPHASACLRPPEGDRGGFVDVWASRLGLEVVMWHHSPGDAKGPGVEAIVERLHSSMRHGRSTVLLHDSGGEGQTVEALGILLERWSRIGYQFKPICDPPDITVSPPNQPPEGAPTISGEPRVGNVLTSHTSAMADGDGIDDASFSYRWLADNVEIAGANSSDFLIPAQHEGKTITVRVSFTDGAGNSESLTGKPTAPVAEAEPPAGSPGAPRNLTLSANTGVVGEVVVSWSAPDNTGGSGITGYQLERKPSWGYWGNPWDVTTIQLPGRSKRLTGLDRRWQHDVRVRAINQSGVGAASEERATPFGTSPLVATFQSVPENHNGTDPFELTIAFTRDIDLGIIAFRDGALDVVGGMVLRVEASENRSDLFKVVILPKGGTHVTVSLPSSRDCHAWGAFCTSDGQVLSSRSHVTVPLGDNTPASGSPAITGTVQVGGVLTADTSSISDADGLNRVAFAYQWTRNDGTADTEISGATGSSYTLVSDDEGKTIKVRVSFTDDRGNDEALTSAATAAVAPSDQQEQTPEPTCGDGYVPPTPTDVDVTVVPVVVESTVDDYFVLYVSHDVDGETVWYPVLVKRGEDGTTTLSESVAALPVERYRVERYSIANPGDVDGDCIDDISEIDNFGAMNPANVAGAVGLDKGALVIPDRETFETLAYSVPSGTSYLKFILFDVDTDRPSVYFLNAKRYFHHFDFLAAIDRDQRGASPGMIVHDPELAAPDGSQGVYRFEPFDQGSFVHLEHFYTLLAASMPVLDDNLALWISNQRLPLAQADLPQYRASRMNLVFDEDVYGETTFEALNPGEGYGLLRSLDPDERPHSRNVVIYEALPNDLPRVAGIISTVPQTPLSHVNLLALQDGVPNAYIADALENDDISSLIDGYVYYAVSEDGYTIRAATQAEVDGHHDASRPAQTQTPERDLTVTEITDLDDIGFDDRDAFGVKAANLAVLRTLGFPEGTVPDGFAIPFYFYDEFMKHNDLYDDFREMLADPDFQSDYDTKATRLKELREKIKEAETPGWIIEALTAMHATYPEGQSLRYRSSTNNEDLPDFNGAGLYDSKTQKPGETEEEGISKSLKQVYASLWNFRAFIERDFHRVDHMAAAMGVLVHPNYQDELVNGVAVSADPAYGTPDGYYVNSQVGEDLVTNPEAHSAPEEVLLYRNGGYAVVALSNQIPRGQLLLTDDQLGQLRQHLATVHLRFAQLYGVEEGEEFAMEIEFKITSDDVLAIKQARPWIFASLPPALDNPPAETPGAPLTASFEDVPATHDGDPFTFRIRFSDIRPFDFVEFRDHAVIVTHGVVTRAARVDRRDNYWEITVAPSSPLAAVTLVLPENRPCTVLGAICTQNGRRLLTRHEQTVPGLPPAPPTGLTALSVSHDGVTLTWDDPGDSSITGYQVLRRSRDRDEYGDGLGAAAFVAVIDDTGSTATTYDDTSVTAHTRYVYRVKAINAKGMSERSTYLNVETPEAPAPEPAPTPSVPAAPTGLAASSATHDNLTLSWDDPGDNSIAGYQVLRRSRDRDEHGDGLGEAEFSVIVDDTGSPATIYTDWSVEAGTRYAYAVKVRNAQGLSEASDAVDAQTLESPASQPVTGEQTAEPCESGYVPVTPTDVAVHAVPVVVGSTADDYFVLYASHDVDGETVWYPVLVKRGESGTTTLSESVASLPVERYRVERYRIDDPGDVDGDCIDDLTELDNLGPMSPFNPAGTLSSSLGKLAIPDHETFRALAYPLHDRRHMKFVVLGLDEAQPRIYFANTPEYQYHIALLWAIDDEVDFSTMRKGTITYDGDLVGPDGTEGVYLVEETGYEDMGRIYTLLASAMPFVDNKLAVWVRNRTLVSLGYPLPLAPEAVRMNLMFDEDFYDNTGFQALNPGEGYGLLRSLDSDERPHSRDVVIYEALPNELPRVAGIISTVPQTPLSHVNLRALQGNVPNAYIADALDDPDISDLIDSYVYYAVSEDGYTIRAATQAEVDAHHDASRPAQTQTPERDLTVTGITDLDDIGFDDRDAFGVKAANLAVLRTLGFPEGTVPDGFAIPFYFYDEFMKQNGLYDDFREMLADPDFRSSYANKATRLKDLRKKIKDAETPEWIIEALTAMHATYPEGQSLRYRSSTNNEDLPDFNGAGLYDSKTQKPGETEEEGISKSLKQVYASLWNFRAFIERDFHRVDHMAAAMGVLVHPNYQDELVNGVAVSADPAYGTPDGYYVNSQVGEDLVTNPEAHSVPEELLLYPEGRVDLMRLSNQNSPGQLLMTKRQLWHLRRHLERAHARFAELYGVEDGERFAVEVEFKIASDNTLAIKQARPWIFAGAAPEVETVLVEEPESPLTARIVEAPGTHDGSPFTLRFEFSDFVAQRYNEPKYAVTVTGGTVVNAWFPQGRGKELAIYVVPRPASSNVHLVMLDDRPCSVRAAICTYNGRRLANRLEHTVYSIPPGPVDRPTGRALSPDSVALEWNEVRIAGSYEVQFRHAGRWTDLPANGTEIEFDGATAVVRGLPGSHHHFRVRAVNSNGRSSWSDQLFLPLRADWEGELATTRTAGVLPAMSGYSAHGTVDGTLSPNTFEFEGTTYEVRYVVHASESVWLNTDRELPGDFIFFVGNSIYRGSESTVPSSWDGVGYWWPSTHPWPTDATVRVGLVVSPDEALGAREKAPVSGYFRDFPPEHDGSEGFSFRLHFSEAVTATADGLRDHVLSVTGGRVSGVEHIRGEGRIWAVSVTPDSLDPVTVEIEAGLDCALPGAICTTDGRSLFNRMVLTVEPLEHHPATGAPTIGGTLEVGETLTADTSGIADGDGMTGATFSYQWVSYEGATRTDIQGATGSTYTLVPADEGKAFRVRVSFTDDAGFDESLTSALALWERPYGLNASESDGAIVLTWKLPVGWSYRSTFQILRNRPELGETEPLVHVRFHETAANTYTDTDVEPGVLYVYRVKAVDAFGYTGEASAPFEIRTAGPAVIEEPAPESSNDNSPATGPPSITGAAQVGATLRASLSDLDDADGLSGATFSYQWFADGTVIPGATGSRYTPVAADAGKTITVRVSFTDDEGNEESLTSEPTEPVAP